MFTKMGNSIFYWLALVLLGVSLEAVALLYQYVLDYWPCVLCIHVRIWVLGFTVAAVLGLLFRKWKILCTTAHALVLVTMIGIFERSWQMLGIERGTAEGMCSMESGLPAWFALDEWFPKMFKVWEPCGYTPELLFGVTMAEALVLFAAVMALTSTILLLASVKNCFAGSRHSSET